MSKNQSVKGAYFGMYKKVNKNGVLTSVFKYAVSGSEEALARYDEVYADRGVPVHTDEESGKRIYFTTVHTADNISLNISDTGAIFQANDDAAKLESKLQTVADPMLKQALANKMADIILGTSAPSAPVAAPAAAQEGTAVDPADTADLAE